jgi:cytochrome c-type biogenesis protein CcmH/NrfG
MPAHPSASDYLHLGQLQEQALSVTDAKASYENALKIDPNLADARQALDNLPKAEK